MWTRHPGKPNPLHVQGALSQQGHQGEEVHHVKQQRAVSGASLAFFLWGPAIRSVDAGPCDVSMQNADRTVVQNLIPLILFRPLRLCVPADQLRNARIILLKATHMPYVVAIWLYESGCRYWNSKRDEWQSKAAHKRPLLASHISLSHKATKYWAVRNRSEISLMAKTPRSGSHGQFAKDPDTLADMKTIMEKLNTQEEMIKKLSRQLDELTLPHPPSPKA
ncbi:MAG: hypothetical protein L6R38_006987 [Xanthoria sp. 2 TBL-2021]|nr:MAG: hypothetical protein L6R38_006987 [Xanthoria sp. 2 TBL-2021]